MSQVFTIRTNGLPHLLDHIAQLQKQIDTANLGDLEFIKTADHLLNSLISLNDIGLTAQTVYYYQDEHANTYNLEAINEMLEKIQQDASKVRLLLRQAAFQVVINPEKIPEYQSRLKILLESLYLSLEGLSQISQVWVDLPLFCLPKPISVNNK